MSSLPLEKRGNLVIAMPRAKAKRNQMLWLAGCDMKNTFHDKIGVDKESCECDNDSMIAMRQGDKKYSDTSALGKGD